METHEIITVLDGPSGPRVREAAKLAVANREAVTPGLLGILEKVRDNLEAVSRDSRYNGHFAAMLLLAQFRERRALPLIIEIVSKDPEMVDDLLVDFTTEHLYRVLAAVSGAETEPLVRLAADEEVEEYVRAAALKALRALVAWGQKPREEVMEIFQGLFRGGLVREPSFVWMELVTGSMELHGEEFREDIRRAFADGLADDEWLSLEDVETEFARGRDAVLADLTRRVGEPIEDAVKELEQWNCFELPVEPEPEPAATELVADTDADLDDEAGDLPDEEEEPVRIVRDGPKVGRNEPCPCGSGKKYKRCCAKKA